MATGDHQGAAGGRRAFRPPDAPLEPEDAPLHLRRARRDPHHRPSEDREAARQRAGVRGRAGGPRRHDPVRGHQEAGARHDRRGGQGGRTCRTSNQRWLGGLLTNFQTINKRIKRLHELTDWTESGTLELLPTRERIAAMNERDKLEVQPRRRARHAAAARRDVRGGHEDGGDRRARGGAAEDPDHRPRRHQLRPGPRDTT